MSRVFPREGTLGRGVGCTCWKVLCQHAAGRMQLGMTAPTSFAKPGGVKQTCEHKSNHSEPRGDETYLGINP